MLWTGFKIKRLLVYPVVLILITGILTAAAAGSQEESSMASAGPG